LLADRRLRLNAAAFYNKYEDIQVLLTRNAQVQIQNAAKATVYGLELDLEARPVDEWLIHSSLGLMHNEFDEWSDDFGDYTDRKLRNAPETTFNPLDRVRHCARVVEADAVGRGPVPRQACSSTVENTPQLGITVAHAILNAACRWTLPNDHWQIQVRGSNLTDERELTGGFNGLSFFGYVEGYYNPPPATTSA
jgi:iron complex outermembrane receptor protein